MRRAKRLLTLAVLIGLIAGACGDSGDDISVSDAWARASAGVQNAGAVYMTISAGADGDSLVGVSVGSEVAGMAQIHETAMNEDGAMMMSQVPSVAVPGDGSVSLEPGGFHVMLMNLVEPLEDGAFFEVELTFATAGTVTVEVEVRDE